MKPERHKTRADILITDLCDEIDYWKGMAEEYKALYEQEMKTAAEYLKKDLQRAREGVAMALSFALNSHDDENGNLVIDKEGRKNMAEMIRNNSEEES